ncbi:MAG: adenine phosphoribosyltransferase [Paludibacter sp.]|nr:adenine phosphoribosyltransferase [Bacteroidales bacterium]MCM1068539.1 adenine phosphoribosyltransferase [Prevotella sp.]MCM1353203.1 adenine phosphoribosyltransferase [Bacteroides sp.]MCM1442389.1 adenine phosphoribosyltransferase [Muribaculum sp.]MCM1481208.1 adenine phosphoribosyltransferase [Paludibacter sp.]
MNETDVKKSIREIPDFPKKGILFYDITTALARPECLVWFEKELLKEYARKGITKVLGIESRGFIMAPMIAKNLNAGFVPIRKPGKLPAKVIRESYAKEYGSDTIEIHADALKSDDVVLIHDDLLATGGTMAAAVRLVKQMGIKKIFVSFLVELDELQGRNVFDEDIEVHSLLHY